MSPNSEPDILSLLSADPHVRAAALARFSPAERERILASEAAQLATVRSNVLARTQPNRRLVRFLRDSGARLLNPVRGLTEFAIAAADAAAVANVAFAPARLLPRLGHLGAGDRTQAVPILVHRGFGANSEPEEHAGAVDNVRWLERDELRFELHLPATLDLGDATLRCAQGVAFVSESPRASFLFHLFRSDHDAIQPTAGGSWCLGIATALPKPQRGDSQDGARRIRAVHVFLDPFAD